jgi:hypothetical protein
MADWVILLKIVPIIPAKVLVWNLGEILMQDHRKPGGSLPTPCNKGPLRRFVHEEHPIPAT